MYTNVHIRESVYGNYNNKYKHKKSNIAMKINCDIRLYQRYNE